MSDSQAASAMERMYEDTTVRDELVDQDATILLQWGEAQIKKLATQGMDDAAFEDAYAKLTAVMGRINRFVGKRHDADDAKLADLLARFVAVAAEAGTPVPPEKIAAFTATHVALDDAAAVRALTAMLAGDVPVDPDPTQPSSPTLPKVPDEIAAPAQSPSQPSKPAAPSAPSELTTPVQAPDPPTTQAVPSAPASPSAPDEADPAEKPETKSPLDNVIKWIQSQSSEGKE